MLSQAHWLQLQDTDRKERRAKTDPQRQSISLPRCEHLQMSSQPAAAKAAVFVPVLLMSNSLGFNPYTCSKSQVAPGQARMQDRRGKGDPRVRGSPGAARRGEDNHSRGCSKKCRKAPLVPQQVCWPLGKVLGQRHCLLENILVSSARATWGFLGAHEGPGG